MSGGTVSIVGKAPPMGARAKALVEAEARKTMAAAVRTAESSVRGAAGPAAGFIGSTPASRWKGGTSAFGTGTVVGSVHPTDFRARFFEGGTGVYGEGPQSIKRPITGRATRGRRGAKALLLSTGDVRHSVQGMRPLRMFERGRNSARPKVEALFQRAGYVVAKKIERSV